MDVAVFGTRNDDNLNRIYRLCAFFGVERLYVVNSRAGIKGNLFSAKQQVKVLYVSGEEAFLDQYFPVIVGRVRMGAKPRQIRYNKNALICIGSEIAPVPREVQGDITWTIPKYGKAPDLTADQALAILLYAAMD